MKTNNISFTSLLEKRNKKRKSRKGKKTTKQKRKYSPSGGPAVGQGGMGGELGGDGGAVGESIKNHIINHGSSLLRELSTAPSSFNSHVANTTAAATQGNRLVDFKRIHAKPPKEEQEETDDDQPEDDEIDIDDEQPEDDESEEGQDDDQQTEPEDPDRQGIIRTVDNAHLVYKRQTAAGDYEELWVYNTGDSLPKELETRRAILAGTDIPQGKTKSDDGSQSYELVTLGNAQLLKISGLPN